MSWILSWNEKKSSSIIPYSVHQVHPGHHLFLSIFCLFPWGSILCIHAQEIFLGWSPMINFIYRKKQPDRKTHVEIRRRQDFLAGAWHGCIIKKPEVQQSLFVFEAQISFSEKWTLAFQCTLTNCKTKWSQFKVIIKIKLKPMYILSRWHVEHPFVVQRAPRIIAICSVQLPHSL